GQARPARHPQAARGHRGARLPRLRRAAQPGRCDVGHGWRGDRPPRHRGARRRHPWRRRRQAGRRLHRRPAGQREDHHHLQRRLRPRGPVGRQGARHSRHQHAGRAVLRHRRDRLHPPAHGRPPRRRGRAPGPRRQVGGLGADPAPRRDPGGQATRHPRHGPHRAGVGRHDARVPDGGPLPRRPAPAARDGAGGHLPRRRRRLPGRHRHPLHAHPRRRGHAQVAERRAHRAHEAGFHRHQQRPRHHGGRRGADRGAPVRPHPRRRPRRVRRRAAREPRLPRTGERFPAAAPRQRHDRDARRHGPPGAGEPRRGSLAQHRTAPPGGL
ncbi:MAG: D-3-phosphoglycerate dehydrogenase, partial [uncultured Acetobacteraceae bacterium]